MRGFCKRCSFRTENPKALFCAECALAQRRESWLRYSKSKAGVERTLRQGRIERFFPEVKAARKAARNAKRRLREATPEGKRKKAALWRKWSLKGLRKNLPINHDLTSFLRRLKEKARKRLRNASPEAKAARRAYMRRYHTKYLGPGLRPLCEACLEPVEWAGRGRPRRLCEACRGGR